MINNQEFNRNNSMVNNKIKKTIRDKKKRMSLEKKTAEITSECNFLSVGYKDILFKAGVSNPN